MHKLLREQIRKASPKGANGPIDYERLLELVDATYEDADRKRRRAEDAYQQLSQEMLDLNRNIVKEAEARFRAIMNNVAEGIVITDTDGRIESMNTAAKALFNGKGRDAAGKRIQELIPAFDAKAGGKKLSERLLSGGQEMVALGDDGRETPVVLTASELRLDNGNRYICMISDITEIKEREREIAATSAYLRAALDNMDQGISMTDPELNLVAFNHRFLELLEFPADLFQQGDPFENFIRYNAERGEYGPGDTEQQVRERVELALRFEPHVFERVRPDGMAIEIRGNPMPGGGFVTTYSDVTTRRNAEEELRNAKETAELANRAKSEFLANMSHELRTPLNAILGFSETMVQTIFGPMSPPYDEYAQDIHTSGSYLLSIINDILDLSKIEAGKMTLDIAEVDVSETVASCLEIISGRAADGGLEIVDEVPNTLTPLMADPRALKQMLLNMLSNAVKFTPEGGRITIAAQQDREGDILISVADSGIGIAPEDVERVFAPFAQVESALTRQKKGTGLGLPLVKALAEQHGGSVGLDTAPEKGTTVTIRLPATQTVASISTVAPAS